MFRFTLKNLIAWTCVFAVAFALSRLVGIALAVVLVSVLVMALLSYEDGLRSSGIPYRGVRDVIGQIPLGDPMPLQPDDPVGEFVRGQSPGPVLWILVAAIVSAFVVGLSLSLRFYLGLMSPFVMCSITGLAYRAFSRRWPVDRDAWRQKTRAVLASVFVLPLLVGLVTMASRDAGGWFLMAVWVGLSMATGIMLSGLRREGVIQPFDAGST